MIATDSDGPRQAAPCLLSRCVAIASALIEGECKTNKANVLHFSARFFMAGEERAKMRRRLGSARAARELLDALLASADRDTDRDRLFCRGCRSLSLSHSRLPARFGTKLAQPRYSTARHRGVSALAESPTYQPFGGGLSGGAAPPPPSTGGAARASVECSPAAARFEISTGPTTPSFARLLVITIKWYGPLPRRRKGESDTLSGEESTICGENR